MSVKSHLQSYPCPNNINLLWNLGFTVGFTIIIQILTGTLLGQHYNPHIICAYESVMHMIREVYYGLGLRYHHSCGTSFVFAMLFIHMGRALSYGSYLCIHNSWFSGILLAFILMGTAFFGYVLPFGQMSFWGSTVITNLLSFVPCLLECLCGGFKVYNPTLERFFVFHFILPFIVSGLTVLHLFYLHHLSSNHPLWYHTNHFFPFSTFTFSKDGLLVFPIFLLVSFQTFLGFLTLSHPDNAFEVSGLLTPLHIYRDKASDSEENFAPFILDGTYTPRNIATL